jgi:hypothetical protein
VFWYLKDVSCTSAKSVYEHRVKLSDPVTGYAQGGGDFNGLPEAAQIAVRLGWLKDIGRLTDYANIAYCVGRNERGLK